MTFPLLPLAVLLAVGLIAGCPGLRRERSDHGGRPASAARRGRSQPAVVPARGSGMRDWAGEGCHPAVPPHS